MEGAGGEAHLAHGAFHQLLARGVQLADHFDLAGTHVGGAVECAVSKPFHLASTMAD